MALLFLAFVVAVTAHQANLGTMVLQNKKANMTSFMGVQAIMTPGDSGERALRAMLKQQPGSVNSLNVAIDKIIDEIKAQHKETQDLLNEKVDVYGKTCAPMADIDKPALEALQQAERTEKSETTAAKAIQSGTINYDFGEDTDSSKIEETGVNNEARIRRQNFDEAVGRRDSAIATKEARKRDSEAADAARKQEKDNCFCHAKQSYDDVVASQVSNVDSTKANLKHFLMVKCVMDQFAKEAKEAAAFSACKEKDYQVNDLLPYDTRADEMALPEDITDCDETGRAVGASVTNGQCLRLTSKSNENLLAYDSGDDADGDAMLIQEREVVVEDEEAGEAPQRDWLTGRQKKEEAASFLEVGVGWGPSNCYSGGSGWFYSCAEEYRETWNKEERRECFRGNMKCASGCFKNGDRCDQCGAGRYKSQVSLVGSCKSCAPGTYQPSRGKTTCRSCSDGRYSSSYSSSICKSWTTCGSGKGHKAGTGSKTADNECETCDGDNEYNTKNDMSQCDKQPECAAGMGGVDMTSTTKGKCVECEEGYYSDDRSTDACKKATAACPENSEGANCPCKSGYDRVDNAGWNSITGEYTHSCNFPTIYGAVANEFASNSTGRSKWTLVKVADAKAGDDVMYGDHVRLVGGEELDGRKQFLMTRGKGYDSGEVAGVGVHAYEGDAGAVWSMVGFADDKKTKLTGKVHAEHNVFLRNQNNGLFLHMWGGEKHNQTKFGFEAKKEDASDPTEAFTVAAC